MSDDFEEQIKASLAQGPRLTVMRDFFTNMSQGKTDMPIREPRGERALLHGDAEVMAFCDEYERIMGTFSRHFLGSIPYILENECRIGAAVLNYAKETAGAGEDLNMFCLANADGNFARTVSGMPGSQVRTLTNSRELGNKDSFFRFGIPEKARFFLGTYLEVTPDRLQGDPELREFQSGFDIIFEHEAFQMFSNRRQEQLAFVTRMLKEDGVMILNEKLMNEDIAEFRTRERQKDEQFKTRYFTAEQIGSKQDEVVQFMESCLVTKAQLSEALSHFFKHAVLVWNSTSFHMVIASNSEQRLAILLKHMLPPCIPAEFCHEELPQVLLGMTSTQPLEFGRHGTVS